MQAANLQARRRVEAKNWKPRNCVWELTLACNLRCGHCGSRAGRVRPKELSTAECLDIVDQLGRLGCELVTLSGGEPTLRKDWHVIAEGIASRGIYVNMVTNGAYRDASHGRQVARRARESGMCNVGVSIDGTEPIHDALRGQGAFRRTLSALEHFRAAGVKVAVLTTLNRQNLECLDELREVILEAGASQWRFQLAKPMGNMNELRDIVLAPKQLLHVIPTIARLKKAGGISVHVGDSIGYYGPYDRVLRGWGWRGRKESWQGCQAGMQALGIEADGGIKGCLSLQTKWGDRDPFVEGNLREESLDEIWHRPGVFAFNRDFDPAALSGPCESCRHGRACRGGARCVSAAVNGTLTETAYCYHGLVTELDRRKRVGASQAAVAAAFALSVGAGCGSSTGPGPGPARDGAVTDAQSDAGDAGDGCDCGDGTQAPECCAAPEYGIIPDGGPPLDAGSVTPDYGVVPDAGLHDAATDGDAIDCTTVCCECDYGVIPPEVYETCCGD